MHKAERNETTTKSFKRLEKTETSLPCRFFRPTSCGTDTKKEDATWSQESGQVF